VAVNGLWRNRECWTSLGQYFWLERWLVNDNPASRLLHFTNSIDPRSPWNKFAAAGADLLRATDIDLGRREDSRVMKSLAAARSLSLIFPDSYDFLVLWPRGIYFPTGMSQDLNFFQKIRFDSRRH
jgi:hypothetical protein